MVISGFAFFAENIQFIAIGISQWEMSEFILDYNYKR